VSKCHYCGGYVFGQTESDGKDDYHHPFITAKLGRRLGQGIGKIYQGIAKQHYQKGDIGIESLENQIEIYSIEENSGHSQKYTVKYDSVMMLKDIQTVDKHLYQIEDFLPDGLR
jgi:hypothetical protein